jgi:energy-coupling factor transport system substrate-specific component
VDVSWAVWTFALLAVAVAAGLAWYERERPSSRVLALVAALAALAVVGRLAFAAVPNVKPTTDIVLFGGYALGAAPGFAVGAVAALVSNVFLAQGPWTVWQMAGWGMVGVAGALLARLGRGREPGRLALAAWCGLAGLAFGAWMDLYQWTLTARQDLDSYLAVAATSLPYNLAHAIGNVGFALLIGPAFVRALRRYRRRFEVRWAAPAGIAALLAGVLLAGVLLAAPVAAAAAGPAAARAERWLRSAQNRDGGFGASGGDESAALFSGWAAIGLAAAGENPRDVRRRGRTLAAYVRHVARSERDIGEVERTVIALRAAGIAARIGSRDLVAEIRGRRRGDGSIAGYVSYTVFGVLALRAAGESAGPATIRWLTRSQNGDGGFGVARSSQSDTDMTGAVLQALAVTGRAGGPVARRAVAHLRRRQGRDGGFGQMEGHDSNAQSTSYAVQGLVAVGAAPGAVSRALAYLRRLQRPDGSVAYSRESTQTPVWVTAQALAALHRAPLPLPAVPRAPRAAKERPPAAAKEAAAAAGAAAAAPPRHRAKEDEWARRREERGAAAAESRANPGRPTGIVVDRPEDEPGGGVPVWLMAAAALAAAGLIVPLRRRLRRLGGHARPD